MEGQTMSRQLIFRFIAACAVALMLAACHATALEEEIQLPGKQEPVVVPERTTIPFSLKVNTEATKVSYATGSYQFKTGDILRVKGVTRTDIEGDLTQNGDVWSGDLTYLTSEGKPADDTALEVMLIHADNSNTESYASALVGSKDVSEVTTAKLLQYAVEHYSLFTAEDAETEKDVTFETTSAVLKQQATFLDVTVTFIFDGSHEMGSGGNAMIDLITSLGASESNTAFVRQNETSHRYDMHFMAVIPGGQSKDAFTLSVVDRVITFNNNSNNNNNAPLERNKKYTVSREIEFVPQLGDPFWNDGSYGRMDHPDEDAHIVGIIVYVNEDKTDEIGNAITEYTSIDGEEHYGHGLVMALHNAAVKVPWWDKEKGTVLRCTDEDHLIQKPSQTLLAKNLSGLANTNQIIETLGNGSSSAASIAKNYYNSEPVSLEYTTGWFLPSIGQWIYTISTDGFGGADPAKDWTNNGNPSNPNANPPKNWLKYGSLSDLIRVMSNDNEEENLLVQSLNKRLQTLNNNFDCTYDSFGIPVQHNYSDNYWTSSESKQKEKIGDENVDIYYAFRMNLGSVETDPTTGKKYSTIKAKPESKHNKYFVSSTYPAKVRPFLAF